MIVERIVDQLMRREYEGLHPGYARDEQRSLVHLSEIMEDVDRGQNLPAFVHSTLHTRIRGILSAVPTRTADDLYYKHEVYGRCFRWGWGDELPDNGLAFQQAIGRGDFYHLSAIGVWYPPQEALCSIAFSLLLPDQVERGSAIVLPVDQGVLNYDALFFMAPVLNLELCERIEASETGSEIHVLEDSRWRTFHFVSERDGKRCYFERHRPNSGRIEQLPDAKKFAVSFGLVPGSVLGQ